MQKCRSSAQLDSDSDSRDRRKAGTHHKAPPSGFHHKQDENDPEAERQDSTSSPGRAPAQQADILELLIGDDCKAVARRASAAMFRRTAAKPAVQIFDPCTGQCVAMQRGDKVHWRDAQGQLRWLTVLGGRTPLVRHLDFYASPGEQLPVWDCFDLHSLPDLNVARGIVCGSLSTAVFGAKVHVRFQMPMMSDLLLHLGAGSERIMKPMP